MNLLEKLALPSSNQKMIEEIKYCKKSYENITNLTDSKSNIDQQKKRILLVAFESLSGLFDLDYEQKLDFVKSNNDVIYIKNLIDKNFDDAFYLMYQRAFYKYLEKMPKFINNRVDKELYSICRLAYLNNDDIVLEKLTMGLYNEIFGITTANLSNIKISQIDIDRMVSKNMVRVNTLVDTVLNYKSGKVLSIEAMKKLYACFSSNIFTNMKKEEKLHLMELLYDCFSDSKVDIAKKYYKEINNSTTNKECLKIIIDELIIPGRTMIILKRNKDTINNLLSGLPFIYLNEIKKDQLHNLDDLYSFLSIKR